MGQQQRSRCIYSNTMVIRIFTSSLLLVLAAVCAAHPLGRRLQIRNEGAFAVEIEWVHPITGDIVPFAGSQQGEVINFHSYVNHTFRFRPRTRQESEVQFVTVGQEDEEQIFVLKKNFEFVDSRLPVSLSSTTMPAAP